MNRDHPNRKKHLARLRKLVPELAPTDSSPDPYRNIAKLAYELAMNRVIDSDKEHDWKRETVERLAAALYDESGDSAE